MIDKNDPLNAEALAFHAQGRPGKFEINATKPLTSQRDLSLAYSPGVAAPCMEIAANAAGLSVTLRRPKAMVMPSTVPD